MTRKGTFVRACIANASTAHRCFLCFAHPCFRSALAEAARIEATALAEVSFGGPMLHAIGYVYVNKADQFLGNPLVCGSFAVRPPFCGHP